MTALLVFALIVVPAHHRAEGRIYHLVNLADVATTAHTHVCVRGKATLVIREADGDLHVRLEDPDGHFIVVESVPGLKVRGTPPKVGEWAKACGVVRFDKKHGWGEIHPVEAWQ